MQALWLAFDEIAGKGIDIFFILKFLGYLSLILTPTALPIGILFWLNRNKINKLGISFLLTLLFIISVVFMSSLDMYWFIFLIEIMASIVLVSLLLDDISKVNATVYTEYKEQLEE